MEGIKNFKVTVIENGEVVFQDNDIQHSMCIMKYVKDKLQQPEFKDNVILNSLNDQIVFTTLAAYVSFITEACIIYNIDLGGSKMCVVSLPVEIDETLYGKLMDMSEEFDSSYTHLEFAEPSVKHEDGISFILEEQIPEEYNDSNGIINFEERLDSVYDRYKGDMNDKINRRRKK